MHSLRTMSTVVSEELCEYLGSNGVTYLPSDCDSLLADENIINRKSTQKNKPVTIVSLLFSYTTWRKSVVNIHYKDWCWSWNSNPLATWCKNLTHLKRSWCWKRLKAGGKGDDREWDGWIASPTQWTWVWVNSRRWWWTGRPGMLQSMGLQRVGHDWVTEMTELLYLFSIPIYLINTNLVIWNSTIFNLLHLWRLEVCTWFHWQTRCLQDGLFPEAREDCPCLF